MLKSTLVLVILILPNFLKYFYGILINRKLDLTVLIYLNYILYKMKAIILCFLFNDCIFELKTLSKRQQRRFFSSPTSTRFSSALNKKKTIYEAVYENA